MHSAFNQHACTFALEQRVEPCCSGLADERRPGHQILIEHLQSVVISGNQW